MLRTSWIIAAALTLAASSRCTFPCYGQATHIETIQITELDLSAADVDGKIGGQLNPALSALPGSTHFETRSIRGSARAVIRSDLGHDALHAAVARSIETLKAKLPGGCVIVLMDWNADELPAMWISISSEKLLPIQLGYLATDEMIPVLDKVDGVHRARLLGASHLRISTDLDPDAMASFGVNAADVTKALEPQSLTGLSHPSVEDIGAIVVRTVQGVPIRVKDVARVHAETFQSEQTTFDSKGNAMLALTLVPGAKPPIAAELATLQQKQGIHMEVACDLSREEATLLEVGLPAETRPEGINDAADRVEKAILHSHGQYGHSVRLPAEDQVVRFLLTGMERAAADDAVRNLTQQLPQFTFRDCQVGPKNLEPFPVRIMLSGPDAASLKRWAEATAKHAQSIGIAQVSVETVRRALVRWDGREVILITAAAPPGHTTAEATGSLMKAAAEERSSMQLPGDYGVIDPGS